MPRRVRAVAPVRICDLGGWTDTWFAGHGVVCNVAISPGAEVSIATLERGALPARVVLDVEQFGDRYGIDPGGPLPGKHPLLEATVASAAIPADRDLEISVGCSLPAGSAVGTSAAIVVALLGALDALTPGRASPSELAAGAHRVETDDLGLQSGVQDQLAAAHGGINRIDIDGFPEARIEPVAVPEVVRRELEERLVLVYLGRPHHSSAVHERVIAALERDPGVELRLEPLRAAARHGAAALAVGDLEAYGDALVENTGAQAALHPDVVGRDAQQVIAVARECGASGWKVNGAGGTGGTVTVLAPSDEPARAALVDGLQRADRPWQLLPFRLDQRGLRVESPS
jgi:D-glycero-alpha-D-manno-heptose-7-phosphate kinase